MKRVPKTRIILDKLHHIGVWTCIALSVAGLCDLSYVGWKYYMYIKPAKKAEELRIKQELLNEGTAIGTNVQSIAS